MPQMPLLDKMTNERIRDVSSELSNAERIVTKTRTKQTAEKAKLDSGEAKSTLANPDFLSQYDLDLRNQRVLGELGWDNLSPLIDPDKLGNNVVVARAMAAGSAAFLNVWMLDAAIQTAKIADAAIIRAKIGDLAVNDAKIANLTVDKLSTGDLSAATVRIRASGMLDAVRGDDLIYSRFSIDGLQLRDFGSFYEDPRTNVGSKIIPLTAGSVYSAWGFTQTSTVQGSYFVGVGDGTRDGRMATRAYPDYASIGTNDYAELFLQGRTGSPNLARLKADSITLEGPARIQGGLVATGDAILNGGLRVDGNTLVQGNLHMADTARFLPQRIYNEVIAANDSLLDVHGLGGIPFRVFAWEPAPDISGTWRPVTDGLRNWRIRVDSQSIGIYNDANSARRALVYVDR